MPKYIEISKLTIQDFLRTSRRAIDDTIVENLNALVTPSREGFDPSSTSQRALRPSQRLTNPSSCNNFKDNVLFPSWKARTEILNYCESVATSSDSEKSKETAPDELPFPKAEVSKAPLYDRSDPYMKRSLPRETEMDMLANLVRNERTVEKIIRATTWRLVAERCGSSVRGEDVDSEAALKDWQRQTGL